MRRISTTTRNRKREKDRDRRRKSKAEISVDAVLQSSVFDPFQLTTCSICGGIEDEDLIILCDGPGCTNEIHMYCMTPLMTKVPEGDWFCEACDKSGTTTALKKYFTDFASTTNDLKPPSPHGYLEYIIMLQQRHVPLDEWKPNAEDFHVVCEFNPSSPDLIGGLLRLSINESQRHTGRIINRRFDKVYERWEHLVQFKSGMEGRNEPLTQWLCLEEHACLVGGTVKWARIPDFPWWPAVEFYQSGMEKIARKYRDDQPSVSNPNRRADKQPADEILHFFFGDESYALISRSDSRYAVPFFAKSREARIYSAKRLNVAYALACLEREEILSTRRAFEFLNSQEPTTDAFLVDGYTTATLKALVDFPSSFNGALQASRASSAADAGAAATGSTVSAGASASGGTEKPAAASVWEVYYRFNQRMMQYEYCLPSTALPSHSRPPPSAATAVSSDAVAIITTATHSSLASSASSAAAPAAVATIEAQASQQQVSAEWERQSALLCLDRVYLAKECGIDVDLDLGRSRKVLFHPSLPPGSDATTTAGAGADSAGESSNSASVAGLQPMLEASSDAVPAKRRRVSNSRYVQDEVLPSSPPTETAVAPSTAAVAASAAAGGSTQAEVNMEAAGSNSSSSARGALVIKPFSIADLIFRKYKEDALRKQEEIKAQQAQQEQERLERIAARKARLSSEGAAVNPWVADGEDFTRKSSRLSSTRVPAAEGDGNYCNFSPGGGKQLVLDTSGAFETSSSSSGAQDGGNLTAATQEIKVAPPTTAPKRSTRRSRKRIQEEENYREFLESNANQPRLLTDLDRDSWVGAAVTYLPTLQRGRVTEYRSGWAVIRTLEGSLNCRPYQLEIIEAESVDMEQFEEEELWALCGEGEGEGGTQQVSNQSMSNEGQSVFPADMEVDDGAGSGDMYFDESGMLYDAFTNDREYDEYLLRQFDIPAGTSAENDLPLPGEMDQTLISDTTAQQLRSTGPGVAGAPKMSRAEIQSIRLQQQKPSRTKLIEVIPPQLTEVEKKRKLDALARSRQQVQQLLRPNAPAATNTHSAGAAPSAVPARSITINRAATSSTILNVSEQHKSEASIPAVKSAERFIPQVMKLGIAPPLAKPSFLRGFGNNWRRPTTEPARRTSFPPTIPTGSTSNPRAERSPAGRVAEVPPPASAQPAITSNNSASSSASGGNSTSMHPAKSQQLTASEEAQREAELQALRDPRLRARLERALPPLPSAAPMRPAGPEIPKMPCLGTARDTDTRSERNSSAAIRTMRANIQYLQAGYAVDGEKALQAAQEKAANNGTFTSNVAGASASSSVLVRRAVTFNVRENSISAAVIDSDVLNITDAADVAAFSPNESDSDESSVEAETIRFNIRAVDEIDRATRPAVQRLPRTAVLVNGGAASAVETSNPASTIQVVAQQDQPRKSRFEAVPAVAHLGFVTPAVLISAAAEQTSQMPMSMPMPMEVQQQQDEVFDDYGYGEYDYPDMPLSKAERRRQKRHAAARAKHQQESAGTFAFINSQDKTNISTTVAVTPTANDAAQNPPAGIQTQRLSERRAAQQSEPPQQRKPTPREDLEPGEVEDDDDLKSLPDEPPQQVVPVDKAVAIGSKKKPAQQQFQQSALSTGVVATASNKPTISSREVKIVKPVEFTPFRAPVREESVNNILAAADRDPASHWRGAAVISGGSLNIPFIADVLESTAASAAAAAAIERASVAASSSKPRRKMHINLDKTYPQFNHRENELLAIAHMDEVMPLSMSNLTALLTESDFFPPIGYTRTEYFPPKSTPLNGYDMGESGYDFETRQEKPLYPLEVHHQSHYQSAEGLQLHHQQYPPPMELPAPAFSTPLFPYQQEQEPHQQAEDPHMHMHMQHHREHRQHRATGNVPLAGGDVPRPSLQEEHQQRSRRSRFETPGGIHPSSHIPDTFAGRQFQESRSDSHIQAQAAQHQQEGAPRTSVRTSRFAAPAQQASVHDRNGAHLNQVPTFPPGHKRDFSAAFHYQQLQDRSLEHHELHSAECLQEERYSDPFYDGRNVHARANANSSDRMVSYAAEPHHSSASYPQQQQHQRDHHASSYTSAHDPGLLLSQDFYTEDRAVSQEVQQNQSGINHNGNKRSRWG